MKNYILCFIAGLFFLLFSGCEEFDLELAPESRVADGNFWKSSGQVESFMVGIHSRLRSHSFSLFQLGSLRADEFGDEPFGGESLGDLERLFYNTLNAENTVVTGYAGLYTNINQINLFIAKTEPIGFLGEAQKNYLLGQAHGLRAFYYFHLVRSWGDVVLYTEPSTAFDLNDIDRPVTESSAVIEFIKNEIAQSESYFGADYSFSEGGKAFWSKAATLMLKAYVYLWSSRQLGGGQSDASVAKAALLEIQSNVGGVGLMDNYADVFSYDTKGNKEIIFAIRNELNIYSLFGGGNFESMLPQVTYVGLYYDSLEDRPIDKQVDVVQVVGRGMTTAVQVSAFRKFDDEDSRKFYSIQGVYNQVNGDYVLAGAYLKKYRGTFDGGNRKFVDDFPIYRYADLLLLLAEAKHILGEDPSAEINAVRARAYGGNFVENTHAYPNKAGDDRAVEEVLLDERLFEFFGEGKRWYDLRRFGKEYVFKYTTAKEDYKLYWPIDIGTLTRNRALTQTSGY